MWQAYQLLQLVRLSVWCPRRQPQSFKRSLMQVMSLPAAYLLVDLRTDSAHTANPVCLSSI